MSITTEAIAPEWAFFLGLQQKTKNQRNEYRDDCNSLGMDQILKLIEKRKLMQMIPAARWLSFENAKRTQIRRRKCLNKIQMLIGAEQRRSLRRPKPGVDGQSIAKLVLFVSRRWCLRRQAPLMLGVLQGLTLEAVGNCHGLTKDQVRTRIHRERARLSRANPNLHQFAEELLNHLDTPLRVLEMVLDRLERSNFF